METKKNIFNLNKNRAKKKRKKGQMAKIDINQIKKEVKKDMEKIRRSLA